MSEVPLSHEDVEYLQTFGTKVAEAMTAVSEDIRALSLSEVENHARPNYQHYQIKIAFWNEYDAALKRKEALDLRDVCSSAKCNTYFVNKMLKDAYLVWWLMLPTSTYEDQMEALLFKCLQRESEILDLPITKSIFDKKTGETLGEEIDTKILDLKLKHIRDIKTRVEKMNAVDSDALKRAQAGSAAPRRALAAPKTSILEAVPENNDPTEIDNEIEDLEKEEYHAKGVVK